VGDRVKGFTKIQIDDIFVQFDKQAYTVYTGLQEREEITGAF